MGYEKKWSLPPGHFSRIYRVIGRVVAARGLPNADSRGKSDPYCIVKGIRSNNHMANIHMTRACQNTLSPLWEESFDYMVPADWGLVELVGLKAMIYDQDEDTQTYQGNEDFLGGCDIDLSNAVTGRAMTHELELAGIPVHKAKGKKPRLTLVVTVYKEVVPKPKPQMELLMASMRQMSYIREVVGKVSRAQALRNADLVGASDPQCIVRVVLLNGEVREIHRTQVVKDCLDPEWNEGFHAKFEHDEQPLLIIFNVWDADTVKGRAEDTGEHLGTAVLQLLDCLPPASRKHKLTLRGDTQLHEGRLNKGGQSRQPLEEREELEAAEEEEEKVAKPSCLDRLSKAAIDLRERVKRVYYHKKVERASITVEIRSRTKTEPMPLLCFMDKPTYVADEDDARAVLKRPEAHWEKCMFPPPTELTERGRPPRGELSGSQQIVFLFGKVHGSSGLPSADENQLSDPFCVVEAISKNAQKLFVHRTRVIPKKLCPEWSESFYAVVPPGFECQRIMFSIYDRDESGGFSLEPLDQDEFLGRASMDISYLCSGEKLEEDVPVSGSFIGSQVRLTTGFRRTPTVSVEVAVERRVKPSYGLAPEDHSAVIPRRTHKVSRNPYSVLYADPSQFVEELPLEELIGSKVLEAQRTGRLLKGHGRAAEWLKQPLAVPDPVAEPLAPAPAVERAPQRPGLDFTLRAPRQKCSSLPLLQSKFEQSPRLFEMTQPHKGKGKLSISQVFNGRKSQRILESLKGLWGKPMPDTLTQRKIEPISAESPPGHGPEVLR